MNTTSTETKEVCHYKCDECGADLTYAPDTTILKCNYCGAEKQINVSADKQIIEESDYRGFLNENIANESERQVIHTVACNACGAVVTLKEHVTSDNCAFCGTPLVLQNATDNSILKPKYLLPFKITQTGAQESFKNWLKKIWFAPDKLKHYGEHNDTLNGVYIPYWTYDSSTASSYTGQRGDDHTEHYSIVVNGKREQRSRVVTQWHYVSGNVSNNFDDILVLASNSIPRSYADKLEPWDLGNLREFDEQFLSGFRTECYQTNIEQGFAIAKNIIQKAIESSIRRDIGGNHQRISNSSTTYNSITFKHILLPIWISAYRYRDKVYRFMINGRTGEVQGERPWSWIKLTLAGIGAASAVAAIYFGYMHFYG